MYPTRLYLFWNTIPSLKILSCGGCNIAEYDSYNCTQQNRLYPNLTFKTLQNAQNTQNNFSTFWWCGDTDDTTPRGSSTLNSPWTNHGGHNARSGREFIAVIYEMTHGTDLQLVDLLLAENPKLTHKDLNTSIDEPEYQWNVHLVSYDNLTSRAKPSSNGRMSHCS